MVSSNREPEPEVCTGHELRNRHTRLIVVLLPSVKTVSVVCSAGAAGAQPCGRLWLIPELGGHSRLVMVLRHLVFANWLGHPSMACCLCDKKSQGHQFCLHPQSARI